MGQRTAHRIVLAALVMAVGMTTPTAVHGHCTFVFNPWGPACTEDLSEQECLDFSADVLESLPKVFNAVPVYVNMSTDKFETQHPNYPDEKIMAHRSLLLSGLTRDEVLDSVKSAIAQWNDSGGAGPYFYYAGEVGGDTTKAGNRPTGVVIDSSYCWGRGSPATAAVTFSTLPFLQGFGVPGASVYKTLIAVRPNKHPLQDPNNLVEECKQLDDEYNPRPLNEDGDDVDWDAPPLGFLQKDWDAKLDGTNVLAMALTHEFGHVLGLNHTHFGTDFEAIPGECGLGQFDVQTWSVMNYGMNDNNYQPRRDDVAGLTDLYGSRLPTDWGVFSAGREDVLPQSKADELGFLGDVTSNVPATVASEASPAAGRHVMASADPERGVRVHTLSDGQVDPIPDNLSRVDPSADTGVMFDSPGVAFAPSQEGGTLFSVWNIETVDSPNLLARWAIRDVGDASWQLFGPGNLAANDYGSLDNGGPGNEIFRKNQYIGAAYDPVWDDFVVLTQTDEYRPAISLIDRNGDVLLDGRALHSGFQFGNKQPTEAYNAYGQPACVRIPGDVVKSECRIPVATSGGPTEVALVTFERRAPGGGLFSTATEHRASENSICGDDCPSFRAYGQLTLAWDRSGDHGWVGYQDEHGDMTWLSATADGQGGFVFDAEPWNMFGNDVERPSVLELDRLDQIVAFQQTWPVAPHWPAAAGFVEGDPSSVNVVRPVRGEAVCGDGFIDTPPFGDEECDSECLNGQTCIDFGFGNPAGLMCADDCTFDSSDCSGAPPPPPECDDEDGTPGCPCLPVNENLFPDEDGGYPDGPGSFDLAAIQDDLSNQPGKYCPDSGDYGQVCGFKFVGEQPNNVATAVCIECTEPGHGNQNVPYGCPCNTDADCQPTGVSGNITLDNKGTVVELSCWGDNGGGWNGGDARCLPKVNELNPNSEPFPGYNDPLQAEVEEFERTKWLCKIPCDELEVNGASEHICIFNNGDIDFDYASCVETANCGGDPGQACANDGGHCGPFDDCQPECDPANNTGAGNPDCVAYGYPSSWECTNNWLAVNRCAPPECRDDPFNQANPGDPTLCDALIYGNLIPQ